MSQQTINVGTTANDGTGDPLRTAGQKINANFTEVYALAQNAYNQANTATFPDQAAFDTANSAYSQANTATTNAGTANTKAQLAFNQANTATTNAASANTKAQSGYDQANTATTDAGTANTKAQLAFDKANTANTLAQSGYDQANTATTDAGTANTKAQLAFDKANNALIDTQSTGIALISNTWSQLQFDPTGTYNPTIIQNGSWLYLDGSGLFYESNIGGNLITTSISAYNGAITFPDSTVQTTSANQGFRNTIVVNTTTYNAANNEEILLCDPNAAGANVALNLSSNVSDGKIFTIKNINPGGYSVNVAATTIEDPVSKSFVSEVVMANTGEVYTWVAHSGAYRHIG